MKYYLHIAIFFCLAAVITHAAPAHAQDCTSPDGMEGAVTFNDDYLVFQGCDGTDWVAFHDPHCPAGDGCIPDPCDSSPTPGTECSNGSFYIGDSPEDGNPVYMTSAAHEAANIRFDSSSCYRCGDGSVATSITDGRANTNALLTFDAAGFNAAAYCDGLTDVHDYSDWYLPAGGPTGSSSEINLIWLMVQAEGIVGGLTASSSAKYFSSTEGNAGTATFQTFNDGTQAWNGKDFANPVRCVRR